MTEDIIRITRQGLTGPDGSFHIDAWEPVLVNIISHAHGDHARTGSQEYWCAKSSEDLLRTRLGKDTKIRTFDYGEKEKIADCWISFHPAGHILGSSQIRIEKGSKVWVFTGDYKRAEDPTCEPFQIVECDVLITEATFGLPIYHWRPPGEVVRQIYEWWQINKEEKTTAMLFCYALGKAQRILSELAKLTDEPVIVHGAVEALNEVYRNQKTRMLDTVVANNFKYSVEGKLVLAPPSAHRSLWMKRFKAVSTAFASGWMAVRGIRRRRGYDRGFVLSDHSDWPCLLKTVRDSKASRILVTHGYSEILARYLTETERLNASALQTLFNDEDEVA